MDESGEQVGDELESVTSSAARVICARLTERGRRLISVMSQTGRV